MQGFLVGGVCFARNATKCWSLFSDLTSHLLVGLTILSLHLTLHKHGRATILSTSSITITIFHSLLCVTENIKQSHAVRGRRFWIEFQPGQGNLDHTHGDRLRSHPRYCSPFFPACGSGTPPRLQSPTTLHPYVWTKINLLLPRGCKVVPLADLIRYLSLPITIFLGMWLVLSNA